MTGPTNQHREEARLRAIELCIRVWRGEDGKLIAVLELDKVTDLVARDQEIREVLEGLRANDGCWCPAGQVIAHSPACLAARGLWERVRG